MHILLYYFSWIRTSKRRRMCNFLNVDTIRYDGSTHRFLPELWILTYLLTPWCRVLSWEANWFAASQEIPRISRNPKVHYRTHKLPPPVSILVQPNPIHIPTSHLMEIHPNIIHSSTPRSPQWSPSLRFSHQDPIHPPLHTHTRHMPSPSHSSRFYLIVNTLSLSSLIFLRF